MSKVAVVTRTHNRPLFLARVLKTVAEQTFSDYVHLIVNDAGSPDAVRAAVAQLPAAQRSRVEVIHNEVSRGREAAVNPGLSRAGEMGVTYVAVLDDDDSWEPDFLTDCVSWLDSKPDYVGVATRTTLVYEEIDREGSAVVELRRGPLAPDKHTVALEDILQVNWVPPVSLLFRAETLPKLTGWREDLPVLSDWDFFLRMLLLGPVGFIDSPLANWHHRANAVGDDGNSVVVAAQDHNDFHAIIRDQALREALTCTASPSTQPDLKTLATPLLLAHYAKALREENESLTQELKELQLQQRERNEEIVRYFDEKTERLSTQLGEVGESVLLLHERMNSMGFKARLHRLFHRD